MAYPQYKEIELPLLRYIQEHGGAVQANETYLPLGLVFGLSELEMSQTLNDFQGHGGKRSKWENMVQWTRNNLAKAGLIARPEGTDRGLWALTTKGKSKVNGKAIPKASYFEHWMRQEDFSKSSILKYEGAICGALTDWANGAQLISGSLVNITNLVEFNQVADKIRELPIFVERNATGHQMYSSALLKYSQYLATSPSNEIEHDIDTLLASGHGGSTEKAALIKARIGQGLFRGKLVNYWKACSVTGFSDVNLLVASHIKPWSASDNNERLDVFNGFLLLPNIDRAFDLGYITFSKHGGIVISTDLTSLEVFGISPSMKIDLHDEHQAYLKHHREHVFERFRKTE